MTPGNSGDYRISFSTEPSFGDPTKTVVVADLFAGDTHVERFQWKPSEFEAIAHTAIRRAAPVYRHIPDMDFGDIND